MPLSPQLNNAFEYILDSNFSLRRRYRKPIPIFEPEKHPYNFGIYEGYKCRAIRITPSPPDCKLFSRYKLALEHCGFSVYTSFNGFQEIRNLYFEIFHNWHSVLLKIDNHFKSTDTQYKGFICEHALALFIDNHDQQVIFFLPLIARDYYCRELKIGCKIDYHAVYVLTSNSRINEFSSSDLYFEMLSNKFGKPMGFEYRNLRGFSPQNLSKCINHNLSRKVGMNSYAVQQFDVSCRIQINSLLENVSFNWLMHSDGMIFNSFIEVQVFTLNFLKYDFSFTVNELYEYEVQSNSQADADRRVEIKWQDEMDNENRIILSKRGNTLYPEQSIDHHQPTI